VVSDVVQQSVPKEYQQSDVGLIPIDWEVKALGELVSSVEYGSSAKSSESGAVPVLRMGNLQSGKIDWDGLVYTSDLVEIAKYKLKKDDVLFNRTNTVDLVGKTSIYKGEYPAVFAGYLIRIHRIEHLLDADFLNYTLNSYHSKKYSKFILSVAVSQANINGQKLKTYPIPTPPSKEEQTAIAKVLSDVDALITSLEKLIAKKRAIKTASMQQLLTGKKRLPPFDKTHTGYKQTELGEIPEDWEIKALGSLCSYQNGTAQEQYFNGHGGYKVISIGNYSQEGKFVSTGSYIDKSHDQVIKKLILNKGDLTMILNDKTAVGTIIGRVLLIEKDREYVMNQRTMRLTSNGRVSSDYLHFLINSDFVHKTIVALAKPGTQIYVNTDDITGLPLCYPVDPEEQSAIVNLLRDMSIELETLEQRLNKTQQLKQGMMQELLTGRTRLL
jgi:type I restriction enzyme S subunit